MSANNEQVGGTHYSKGGSLQHWDIIEDHGIGYLEGYATKYLVRWRVTGTPLLDLGKSRHATMKLLEKSHKYRQPRGCVPDYTLKQFFAANDITADFDKWCISTLLQWRTATDLRAVETTIEARHVQLSSMIAKAPNAAVSITFADELPQVSLISPAQRADMAAKVATPKRDNTGQARPFGYNAADEIDVHR